MSFEVEGLDELIVVGGDLEFPEPEIFLVLAEFLDDGLMASSSSSGMTVVLGSVVPGLECPIFE